MKIQERDGKLTVVDFNEFDAMRIACKIEKDGIWFYERLKSSIKHEAIKKSLEFLIAEEVKHLAFFEDVLEELREKKEDEYEEDDLLTAIDFGIFQPYQGIAELENIVTTPAKAVRLGLVIEDKSIQFYEACRRSVSGHDTQQKLAEITAQENRHKALLEGMLAGL